MAEAVVVAAQDGNAIQTVAELEAEAVSDAASAAVEIARINAERDVAVAEVHADATTEQTQVAADVALATAPTQSLEERVDECQRRSETIQTMVTELAAGQQSILARLEVLQPPPPPPPVADGNAVMPDNQEAPPAPARPKPKFKLI